MRFDSEKEFREILRRGEALRREKERHTVQMLAITSSALLVVLVLGIHTFSLEGNQREIQSVFGAFLLPAEAGGYILAAVLAFFIGVAVTFACMRYRMRKENGGNIGQESNQEVRISDDLIAAVAGGQKEQQEQKTDQ